MFVDVLVCTAITLDAGVQFYEAYAAANDNGRLMVGGISPGGSIGAAGGWLAGGGHSLFSPSYGLGKVLVDDPTEHRADRPMKASITLWKYLSCFRQVNT